MARPPAAPAAPQQAPLGPGDIGGLFECLQGALQPATQKQCEAVLLGLEQRPGYSSCLLVTPGSSSALRLKPPATTTFMCRDDPGLSQLAEHTATAGTLRPLAPR